jgi:uncharacterized protein YfaS (alpha-2-macroglobulin family)
MRRWNLGLLLALTAILSLSWGLSAQDADQIPLVIVDSSPAVGQEVTSGDPINVVFDRALNCDTVADAVTIETASGSPLEWTIDCADDTITVSTDDPLLPNASYTVDIAVTLRASDGGRLAESFSLPVRVQGFLEVTSVLPTSGSLSVGTSIPITVVFNRPVVALTSISDTDALPSPLTLEPDVPGQGRWLNTSVYQFEGDPGLPGGVELTVTVADVTAIDGAQLAEPFVFSFKTLDPILLEWLPNDRSDRVSLRQTIDVRFNQAMDRESTQAAFYLQPEETTAKVAGSFEWAEDSAGFRFTPDALLAQDVSYVYGFVADGALNVSETVALPAFEQPFLTAPFPSIVETSPSDGNPDVPVYDGFTLYFASDMNPETLLDKVTISPEPTNEITGYFSTYNDSYSVSFGLKPTTSYTVTIAPGMEDIYGNAIETPFTFSFATGGLDSEFSLRVPGGDIGLYDADRPQTELYLAHQNIDAVDMNLFTVDASALIRQLVSDRYYNLDEVDTGALVRSWQVDTSAAPANRRFLTLENIGDSSGSDVGSGRLPAGIAAPTCTGAPAARAKIGDRAEVTTEPDPLRARSAPVSGEVVDLLYKGYAFEIVAGPRCEADLYWYEISLRDGGTAWVAEGLPGEYFFTVTQPSRVTPTTIPSDVLLDGGALPLGVYRLTAAPDYFQELGYSPTTHLMLVSNTALLLNVGVTNTTVWATDLHTGQPLANLPVSLRGFDGWQQDATTDADGVAYYNYSRIQDLYVPVVALVQTEDRFGLTSNRWTGGMSAYRFGVDFDAYPQPYKGYLYTDRPVYRPGQPVHFRGVIRSDTDNDFLPPDMTTIPVKITDSGGVTVYEKNLPLSPYGTFTDTLTLDSDGVLGYYTIVAEYDVPGRTYRSGISVGFDVAQYRLPEFQIQVTAEQDEVVRGEPIQAVIDATYFFGGPVSDANVTYSWYSVPFFFNPDIEGRYEFGDVNYDGGSASQYYDSDYSSQQSARTDALGKALITIPTVSSSAEGSRIYQIEATINDESGQYVSGRTEVIVHQGKVYVGVGLRDFVAGAGIESIADLIAVDWDGNPVPDQPLDVTFLERQWNSVQELDPYNGQITWKSTVEEIELATDSLTTDADGKAEYAFTPPTGGIFKVRAETRDEDDRAVKSATTLWSSGSEYVAWRQTNEIGISLVTDKQSYQIGDVAEILIPSPFQGSAEALITLERDSILRTERITLTSNSTVYRLPIEEDFAPTIYLNVAIVKGVDEFTPVADMRVGFAQINVDNSRFVLDLDLASDLSLVGPGDTVNFTVTATDHTGAPQQAELGVGLTDLASLSLGQDQAGLILDAFYRLERLSVQMASAMIYNTDLITEYTRDVIKGGGGGGGGGGGIIEIREDFLDTAFWNGSLETNADGVATFSVTLPDNLTTWRLNVRAVTAGIESPMLVGQEDYDILSTKPLLVRPVAPRFFVFGDEVVLAAVVNNNTSDALTTDVTLQATGVRLDDESVQTVSVPANGRIRVEWRATVTSTDPVELIYFAESGDFNDATRPQFGQGDQRLLPVYRFEAPEFIGTGGALFEAGTLTEAVVLPRTETPITQGSLTVEIAPSLAVASLDGLRALNATVCECTESSASRLVANVTAARALALTGETSTARVQTIENEISRALQRLAAQQRPDGGWGWYSNLTSSPLVTAWVVIALDSARDAGYVVDSGLISKGGAFLLNNLTLRQRIPTARNLLALELYALTSIDSSGVTAALSTAFDDYQTLDLYGQSLLLMALHENNPDDTRIATLRDSLLGAAIFSANGVHWEEGTRDYRNWNSNTRTSAMALRALISIDPENPLLRGAVRWLMTARQADAWETTQETAWSLLALADWMQFTGEAQPDYEYRVAVNDAEQLSGQATSDNATDAEVFALAVDALDARGVNLVEIGRGDGAGALYYTAYLNLYLPVPDLQPVNRGVIVQRDYRILGADDQSPVLSAEVGQLVEVTLTIIAPNSLNFLLLEDPIPAGTEPVDTNLATAQQTGTSASFQAVRDENLPWWYSWWWADAQFRDESVVVSVDYLAAGTYQYRYMLRPTVEGRYNVIPTTAREFYFPEVYGRGSGALFTVLPASE